MGGDFAFLQQVWSGKKPFHSKNSGNKKYMSIRIESDRERESTTFG